MLCLVCGLLFGIMVVVALAKTAITDKMEQLHNDLLVLIDTINNASSHDEPS